MEKFERKSESPDLFDYTKREYIEVKATGGADKHARETNLMQLEWAIKYAELSPREYLMQVKNYSRKQTDKILAMSGSKAAWVEQRSQIVNKMTESTIKVHIDKMLEMQGQHINASETGMNKAITYIQNMNPTDENFAKDLSTIMGSVEKCQNIFRKAFGITDEADMKTLVQLVQNNVNIQGEETSTSTKIEEVEVLEQLTYDEIKKLIDLKRNAEEEDVSSVGENQES